MNTERAETMRRLHWLCMGSFFGLAVLKFGNPCVMERFVAQPENGWEWLFNTWPNRLAYGFLAVAALSGLAAFKRKNFAPKWLVALPVAWFAWQLVSATATIDASLTGVTLKHFAGIVVCFYVGFFCGGRDSLRSAWFWWPVMLALGASFAMGIDQHFGGLERTRTYFLTYIYPTMKEIPPEYQKRVLSDRIFGTLFYPNALAGAIILLLPAACGFAWQHLPGFTVGARRFLATVLGLTGLACLYWSGSKGGWLIMLGLVAVGLSSLKAIHKYRGQLLAALVVVGVGAFTWRYLGFFQRGATSVHARLDYWVVAVKATGQRPVLGGGPGTFGVVYPVLKRPGAEMTRLVHNDYLQQFADSGLLGGLLFGGMIGLMVALRPKYKSGSEDMMHLVGLGLAGFLVQSFGEFGFYIPALGWFASYAGGAWLAARWNGFDSAK
jgi:O-antigen ligase